MNCKQVEKKLSAFQDKTLPAGEMLKVENHLKNCPVCLRIFEELKQAWQLLSDAETIKSAPFFWTRIAQKLTVNAAMPTKRRLVFHPAFWSPVSILTIVLLIFSFFSGIYFGKTIFQKITTYQQMPGDENLSEQSTINTFDDYTSENISEVYVSIISENSQ